MTYKEYSEIMARRNRLISRKRSLEMTIRMNEAWLTNQNSVRGKKRLKKIKEARNELVALTIPPKPKQPIGYEVLVDGVYEGFYATDDIEFVKESAQEILGHNKFKLKQCPRYRDQ